MDGWIDQLTQKSESSCLLSCISGWVIHSESDCSSNNIIGKHACRCQENCDADPPQILGVGVFWRQKEDCFIPWILFLISSWIDNKIQWEHCCNCNILLGTKLQVNRKSFTFPFSEYLNDWTKSRKLSLLDYSIE